LIATELGDTDISPFVVVVELSGDEEAPCAELSGDEEESPLFTSCFEQQA
jgi:hypothetical protein